MTDEVTMEQCLAEVERRIRNIESCVEDATYLSVYRAILSHLRTPRVEAGDGPWPKWKDERCPITRRPYFMHITHPELGTVPTYGGPFDSYTTPVPDDDGNFHSEHYCHDRGDWIEGGEPSGLYLVTEAQLRDVADFISCGHVGDGPSYQCLLCGQLGADHPAVLRRALTDASDELLRYIDFMHKSDYREYAAPVEAKVQAINALLATAK